MHREEIESLGPTDSALTCSLESFAENNHTYTERGSRPGMKETSLYAIGPCYTPQDVDKQSVMRLDYTFAQGTVCSPSLRRKTVASCELHSRTTLP